jgi:DinB family protein
MAKWDMPESLAKSFEQVLAYEYVNLRVLSNEQAAARPAGLDSWSRKEELGHLIDSAVNNHVRFAAASLQTEFSGPTYEQDGWVRAHGYHEMPWLTLLDSWRQHNDLLLRLVKCISEERLTVPCRIGSADPVTLRFLIEDYVLHMQHHLDHILSREKLTLYPGAAAGI